MSHIYTEKKRPAKDYKNPRTIAAKRWREHMNRSRAQQARRKREKAPIEAKWNRELESKMRLGFASSTQR